MEKNSFSEPNQQKDMPLPPASEEKQSKPEETSGAGLHDHSIPNTPLPHEIKPVASKKMPAWVKKNLIGLAVILIIFVAGYVTSQISSAAALRNNLRVAEAELDSLKEELNSTKTLLSKTNQDLSVLQNNYSELQSESQQTTTELNNLLSATEYNQNLSALLYDVALTRIALASKDKLSAKQNLSLADTHFNAIAELLDKDTRDSIRTRLEEVHRLTSTNLTSALEELRTLTENLERIPKQ